MAHIFGQAGCLFLVGEQSTHQLTDWDYPHYAQYFGWSPCHRATDGTIDCPTCSKKASSMIAEATQVLYAHLEEPFELEV